MTTADPQAMGQVLITPMIRCVAESKINSMITKVVRRSHRMIIEEGHHE